jgi:hypothetical protein
VSISPSTLDALLACPARWFLEHEAGGRTATTSSQGFGNIVHALADRLTKDELGPDTTEEQLMQLVDRVWDEVAFATPWSSTKQRTELERALRRPPAEPERLPELERIERAVTLATATDFDAHARLRPVLCEIAEARLAARGIRLDDSAAARAILGEETWELVRPDRKVARGRNTPGPDAEQLRRVVAVLEGLGP